ncbi:MAG: hypothetical protein U0U69_11465 [Acidimicrobiia bacterium]
MQHAAQAKSARAGVRSGRPPRRQWAPVLVPVAVGASMFMFGLGLGAARSIVTAPPSVQQVREQLQAELAVRDQTLLSCRTALERMRNPVADPAVRAETDALAEQCRVGVVPSTTLPPDASGG